MRINNDIKGKSDQPETWKLMRLATVRLTWTQFCSMDFRFKETSTYKALA